MSLRKQPLVHVFPGEEVPRRPEPPPLRYELASFDAGTKFLLTIWAIGCVAFLAYVAVLNVVAFLTTR